MGPGPESLSPGPEQPFHATEFLPSAKSWLATAGELLAARVAQYEQLGTHDLPSQNMEAHQAVIEMLETKLAQQDPATAQFLASLEAEARTEARGATSGLDYNAAHVQQLDFLANMVATAQQRHDNRELN